MNVLISKMMSKNGFGCKQIVSHHFFFLVFKNSYCEFMVKEHVVRFLMWWLMSFVLLCFRLSIQGYGGPEGSEV